MAFPSGLDHRERGTIVAGARNTDLKTQPRRPAAHGEAKNGGGLAFLREHEPPKRFEA